MKPSIPRDATRRARARVGNVRRGPRSASEPIIVTSAPSAQSDDDRGGTGLGRLAKRGARVVLRLGICVGLAYGVLVGVREGYAYATTSPRFEVRALEFRPTAHIDEATLRELLALTPGTNILALDLDDLATRVAAHPWVARAVIDRQLPDALRIDIEEHEAVAVLWAGTMLLVDAEGEPFKRLDRGERARLPVITGVEGSELIADPEGVRGRIARALELVTVWQTKRRPLLSEIHVDKAGGLTLYTAQVGSQLRVGRGDLAVALGRFDALRAALGDESDKLAVAHLDGDALPDMPERVVASFFPAKDVPKLVVEAHERAAAGNAVASPEDDASASASDKAAAPGNADENSSPERAARKQRLPRIPRHH